MESEKDCAEVAGQKQSGGIDEEGSIMGWVGKASL